MKRTIAGALVGFGLAVLLGVSVRIGPPARGDMKAVGTEPGRYVFLPFRQNLWVIDKQGSVLLYYKLPSTEEEGIMKSRLQVFDADRFPSDETHFLLSSRNLTDYLWICNAVTGDVQVLRYNREGAFDTHYTIAATKDFHLPAGAGR